jgi:hypothetical protein
MRYSWTISFVALMVWGGMSPVFACRSANNATILKVPDSLVRTGVDQYNVKVDIDRNASFNLVTAPSPDSGFCVNLSVLDSSDVQNATTGVIFWGTATTDSIDEYYILIRNDQYRIVHQLFGKQYELVPWTTDASIKKGIRQKNEVDVKVTATGADIQINGTELTKIVARPSADAQYFGVVFQAPETGAGLFQFESPRISK